jgi:hypothetical protein
MADIAAELRQRDEDLRRVRDQRALAQHLRRPEQVGGVGVHQRECLVRG